MTGNAAEVLKQLLSVLRKRAKGTAAGKPGSILRGLHHHDPANHPGVHGAAILSTEQVILSGLGRMEPQVRVARWQHISLLAKRWYKETVDNILRNHVQYHIAANRNMQLVDFALPIHVLELPHPLLGDYIDLLSVLGRQGCIKINYRAPHEHQHKDAKGNDTPGNFQNQVPFNLLRRPSPASPVLHGKDDDQQRNQHRHGGADRHQEHVDGVDPPGVRGCALGEQHEIPTGSWHYAALPRCFFSPRSSTATISTMPATVSAPNPRTTIMILGV